MKYEYMYILSSGPVVEEDWEFVALINDNGEGVTKWVFRRIAEEEPQE